MKKFLSYLSVELLKVVAFLPFGFFYFAGDIIYLLSFHLIGYRRKVVYNNLRNSFPEKSEEEIHQIEKKYYRHFGDMIVEPIKCHGVSLKTIRKRVVYTNPEVLSALYDQGRDVVLVSGHYGNWEMLMDIASCSQHEFNIIYKPLNSVAFDKFVRETRTRFNINALPMDDAYRTMVSRQRAGIRTITYFLADQAPVESKYWTTFLNQETSVFLGPEKIASKLKMAVVFMSIMKTRRGHYEVTFTPICDDASQTPANFVTNTHVRLLENIIRQKPEFWLWSHRRWKRSRPEGVELQ